ncbi:2Fe-2S iron-sulfur cluster-binding protein [Brevibacterium moorei]|uniref:2Fe-2S iron-sulfur cluster-binding protein n=1 Tax=Brevibacterium moorei TaxID=2968457 RepID=UPI00211C81BC|nr:2Fe-2S iron-sulfur cluster-binding protein [Brevibacterium sp. 68QC2CO]MCQ9386745.1 2Fe-2S iron-sulfur cluster-binding protein [Brevibacterium sp. 68QC2CO]
MSVESPASPHTELLLRAGFTPVAVTGLRRLGPRVLELTLDRREPFSPGSHIEVALATEPIPATGRREAAGTTAVPLIRHYSLSSDPTGATPWTIAVQDSQADTATSCTQAAADPAEDAAASGSAAPSLSHTLHTIAQLRELFIRGPRNNFHFRAARPAYFVAGGIGITPLRSMLIFAAGLELNWHLLYVGRGTDSSAGDSSAMDSLAYAGELLTAFGPEHVTIWDTAKRGRPDLAAEAAAWLGGHPQALVYTCGPAGFADALRAGLAARPETAQTIVESELFDPAAEGPQAVSAGAGSGGTVQGDAAAPASQPGAQGAVGTTGGGASAGGNLPFTVELADGRTVPVGEGESILQALTGAGVRVLSSCQRGTCGTCETRILAGRADHRDHVLDAAEREANETMMICVSRSCDPVLKLDL